MSYRDMPQSKPWLESEMVAKSAAEGPEFYIHECALKRPIFKL
jgi:hypothetical protein